MLEELTWENIAFPLQDKIDRHCTQPMSEIYPSYTRIQQFETERTFRELEDMLESNSSHPAGKDKIFLTGILDAPWTWLINHLSKEHPMILVFKGLSALLLSMKTWYCALYTPVYGRTPRIVKVKRFSYAGKRSPCFLLGKYELGQLETVTIYRVPLCAQHCLARR